MDAVRYLKEKHRMTKECNILCKECPFGSTNNGLNVKCVILEVKYTEKAVEIVKKWSEEHPKKTYLMDFLEKYPNCKKNDNGIPDSCRDSIYGKQSDCYCASCEECWNEPMED